MRLVNYSTYTTLMKWGEKFTLPSKTVPNMTLSLKELLERYVRGQDVTIFEGDYDADQEDMPDVSRMDQMERLDLARELRSKINHFQKASSKDVLKDLPFDTSTPEPHNQRSKVPVPPPDPVPDPVSASV